MNPVADATISIFSIIILYFIFAYTYSFIFIFAFEFWAEQGYSVVLPEKLDTGKWNVYRYSIQIVIDIVPCLSLLLRFNNFLGFFFSLLLFAGLLDHRWRLWVDSRIILKLVQHMTILCEHPPFFWKKLYLSSTSLIVYVVRSVLIGFIRLCVDLGGQLILFEITNIWVRVSGLMEQLESACPFI